MKRYRRKPEVVEAQQWHEGGGGFAGLEYFHVNSLEPYVVKALAPGFDRVRDGNWVVTDGRGKVVLLNAKDFEELYEPVD